MGRAHGKHSPRKPEILEVDPESPLGRQLGMSPRTQGVPSVIPGGRLHIANAATVDQEVPVTAPRPEYGPLNAHGVPPGSATTRERAEVMRGPNSVHEARPEHEHRRERPLPIPVYLVQEDQPKVLRSAYPLTFQVPAAGTADPVRLCGRDEGRSYVLIMNEDASNAIRFAQRPSDLPNTNTNPLGALLPGSANPSYLKVDTQDELFAVAMTASASVRLSVIQVTEREMS